MLPVEATMPPDPVERAPRRPFLSRGEVSRLFGVSVSTVTRWARLGLLKVVRTPGGHYRFPADETRRAAERAWNGELTRLD
jgi:excisionase family DNA binding protein